MKSKLHLLAVVMLASCAVEEGEITAEEQQGLAETATYGFEGSLQGWAATSGGVFTVSTTSTRAWAGTQSMALKFTGRSGKQQASLANPPFSSGTITAHVYVPWGAALNSVQLFTLEKTSWRWRSTWVGGSSLKPGAWNTLQLIVPAGTYPIASVGLEVDARSGWYGTMNLDSVQLGTVTPVVADAGTTTVADAGTRVAADAGTTTVVDAGTSTVVDAGTVVVDAGAPPPPPPPPPATGTGLRVNGNHIYLPSGAIFHGRGANLNDTRSCNACTAQAPNVAEVKRRIDELVDGWKANFIRLDLEAYASSEGWRASSNYQSALYDSQYLTDMREIVRYIGTKPGVYVLVSLWTDPSIDSMGRPTINPTIGTDATWRKIAAALADQPQALFGIINEPQMNYDGSGDATVHSLMSSVVRAIRETEEAMNVPYHVVTVQGTGGWARLLGYYVTHPITERNGAQIAYEIHVYNPQADFQGLFGTYAASLPIIIGEFGPMSGTMSAGDCTALMDMAQRLEIPHLSWTFHMRCNPSLLVDNSSGGCGVNMPLAPTTWGTQLKQRLATPW